jgi:Na+/proline symporter
MGIGVSLFLLAVGAVLAFAVADNVSGVDLVAVGWILMAVGVLGALLSALFWSSWGGLSARRRTTVIERERDLI